MKSFFVLLLLLVSAPWVITAQSSRYQFSGNYVSHQRVDQGVELVHEHGKVRIDFLAGIGFRLRYTNKDLEPVIHSNAVVSTGLETSKLELRDDPRSLFITMGDDVLHVTKQPLRILFQNKTGHVWLRESLGAGYMGDRIAHVLSRPGDEHYFGLATASASFGRAGASYPVWNTSATPVSVPFLMGLRGGFAWGVFYDNPWRAEVDVSGQLGSHMGYFADGGELRMYLISGPSQAEVLRKYTMLTGRSPLPPLWSLGFQAVTVGHVSEASVLRGVSEFRGRNFPIDAIQLNLTHTSEGRSFTWDGSDFPDAARMVADLSTKGVRTVLQVNHAIRDDAFYEVRNQGIENDVFVKLPDNTNLSVRYDTTSSLIPDFSKPSARTWWGSMLQRGLMEGVSGFQVSMDQPDQTGRITGAALAEYHNDGNPSGQLEMNNQYGLLMAKATREGLSNLEKNRRVPITATSGFAGVQQYAYLAPGMDITRWEELRLALPSALNSGISGLGARGMRIGGVQNNIDADLYARSLQLASLMPLAEINLHQEESLTTPWSHGGMWERGNKAIMNLRYRLLPSIYSAWWLNSRNGAPIVRPLTWNWPNDAEAGIVSDQFMLGDHLMVAPVVTPDTNERSVYLPEGLWYRFHTREKIPGGQHITEPAPMLGSLPNSADESRILRTLPMFVRAGAVISEREAMEHVEQKPVKEMLMHVFAGANATSYLYEDDGKTLANDNGEYRALTYITEAHKGGFRIRVTSEGRYEAASMRFSYLIHGLDRKPDRITVNGRNIVYFYEPSTNTIVFKISAGPTDIDVIYR